MGLLDFLKPKKSATEELFQKIRNQMFPKGDKDINAGADELLHILNNSVDRKTARSIFVRSLAISKVSEEFDEERLRAHLSGYCLQYFASEQVKKFYNYIVAINAAMMINRRTPSEVKRNGETYFW
jgi:dihydroorotase